MRKVLITAAAFDALTTAGVKARPELRISKATDDTVIADLITSAVEAFQDYTNSILCQSTWDLYFDGYPNGEYGEIETPGPLVSVTSVKYLDSATSPSQMSAVDSSYYLVDTTDPIVGRISLVYGNCWNAPEYDQANNVVVRIVAGYASAAAIPQQIKEGLYLHIQEGYYGVNLRSSYQAKWDSYRRFPI